MIGFQMLDLSLSPTCVIGYLMNEPPREWQIPGGHLDPSGTRHARESGVRTHPEVASASVKSPPENNGIATVNSRLRLTAMREQGNRLAIGRRTIDAGGD